MTAIAYTALFGWPLVAIYAFLKKNVEISVLVTVIGGYMFLPVKIGIDLPILPEFDKESIPVLSAFVLCLFLHERLPNTSSYLPKHGLALALIVILVFGSFFTVLQNEEPLFYGPRYIPGLKIYDAFSVILALMITLLPFFLGHKFFATSEAQKKLLLFMVAAGLLYSVPALLEVRISPQLHRIFYGEHPHNFAQTKRFGGFRPTVFIGHGLTVAIFFALCTLSAIGLYKSSTGPRKKQFLYASIFLFFMLILCKSVGAILITSLMACLILVGRSRIYFIASAAVAILVLTYPVLRGSGYIPTEEIVIFAQSYDEDRADSLAFRLRHEDSLLEKASEKPIFGWGGYGRNRIFDDHTGRDLSIVDGTWISIFGSGGWVRYAATFGLMCLPLILAAKNRRRYQFGVETSLIAVLLAANLIDLIPNSGLSPITWLLIGGLWGRISLGKIDVEMEQSAVAVVSPALRYSRGKNDFSRQTSNQKA